MADGTVIIDTLLDSTGVEKGLKTLGTLASKGAKTAAAAVGGVATAIGGIAAAAGNVGMNFEAQMSRVQAISGATAEELERLKDQAVDLGAETAFSATETAEGMENLASAGFDVQEIMDAMPGMLDLAASSGEDLAASADIAASTLRGFGLEASDAGHVADVLAKNAADTNAAVADTGEAMKYIAPLAHAAGISLEETAAAIGIMADNGIKGSQAGTTLRGALSRLSKPTQDMQQAMDELGISFYDSEGKMLSLSDQISMLKKSMEGMTDEQRNNYLVTLYGQESLSGMLALINTTDGKLVEMTESYRNCDGAAEEMATTMQDNLKSAIEQVGGAAESFGITVYESIQDPLKDAAFAAADAIDQITEAFKEDGPEGAAEAAGEIMANLLTGIAEALPDVINTAVAVIDAFIDGIVENKDQLLKAAGEIATALVEGLVKLLPKEIGDPIQEVFEDIGKSLQKGGLKKGIEAAIKIFDRLIKTMGKIIDTVGPALVKILDFIGENLDVIGPIAIGVVTALLTFQKVSSVINSVTTSVKALTTALSFSPAGILTGITSIIAGFVMWEASSESAYEKAAKLTEEEQALADSVKEHAESVQQSADSVKSAYDNISLEYENAEGLVDELRSIADENGRIKDGYQERAQVITEELASAFGVEIQMTDGVIENYQEVIQNLDQIIAKKKASAMVDAMGTEYVEAQEKTTELVKDYTVALKDVEEQQKKVAEAEQAVADAQEKYNDALEHPEIGPNAQLSYYRELEKAQDTLQGAKDKLDELNSTLSDSGYALSQNQAILENYDNLQRAIATGSTEELNDALIKASNTFITAATGSQDALERQKEQYQQTLEDMKAAQESGMTNITDENIALVQNLIAQTDAELRKLSTAYQEVSAESVESFLSGLDDMPDQAAEKIAEVSPAMVAAIVDQDLQGQLSEEGQKGVQAFIDGIGGMDEQTKQAMAEALDPMLQAIYEADPLLYTQAAETTGSLLNAITTTLGVGSPMIYSNGFSAMTELGRGAADATPSNVQAGVDNATATATATSATLTSQGQQLYSAAAGYMAQGSAGISSSDLAMNAISVAAQAVGMSQAEFTNRSGEIFLAAQAFAQSGANGFTAADLRGIFGSNTDAAVTAANNYLAQGAVSAGENAAAYGGSVNTAIINADMPGTMQGQIQQVNQAVNASGMPKAFQTEADKAGNALDLSLQQGGEKAKGTTTRLTTDIKQSLTSAHMDTVGRKAGSDTSGELASGIRSGETETRGAVQSLTQTAIRALQSAGMYDAAYGVGQNFGDGLAAGIASKTQQIASEAAATVRNAINAANAEQDANSPAKKVIPVGENWGGGVVVGIEKMQPKVDAAAARTMAGAIDVATRKAALAQMRAAIGGTLQRAVMDLSLMRQQPSGNVPVPAEPGEVNQTVNIYQPVKSPVEMSREMKKTAKEMTWH